MLQTTALQVTETVAGGEQPITLSVQGFQRLFRIRHQGVRLPPCRTKSMFEGVRHLSLVVSRLTIRESALLNELLRIEFHHFRHGVQAVLGFREKTP